MLSITASFGKLRCVEYSISGLYATKQACSCVAFAMSWNEGRTTSNAWSQRHSHIFQTQKSSAVKTKHLGNLQSESKLPKKLLSVYIELFFIPCFALPGPGQGQVSASSRETLGASSWVTGLSLFSINKTLARLCFAIRLPSNIAVLVPIDPSSYCRRTSSWRARRFSRLEDNPISWVSLEASCASVSVLWFRRHRLCSWVSLWWPADVSGAEVCKHFYV